MDLIINTLKKEIKDGFFEPDEDYFIINAKFQYDEDEENILEENGEDLNEDEEEEDFIDDKFGIIKKDLFIQIILFKSENDESHIIQFYKKSGEIEDYYQKLENIISIIKKLIKK